jgi:uncharacterized FlaG/YvyC family protein
MATKKTAAAATAAKPNAKPATAADTNPLPVLDICNNLITVTSYIGAIESATVPAPVVSANPTLATQYSDWQETIWEQFFDGLLNAGIMAEAEEINKLIGLGITDQTAFQEVVNAETGNIPTVINLCDDMTNQIAVGVNYLTQMQAIANQIQNADKTAIAQLNQIISTLNSQFDSLEDQLTEKAIDNGKEVVVTIVEVGVAVATEEDPISPLVKGVAQVGFDVINELVLSSEINDTLSELETEWSALDQATLQLAQITLTINQLNAITSETSAAITALNNIVNDWQIICDLINNDSPIQWTQTGLSQLAEWAARMNRVQFYGQVSQSVGQPRL